LFHQGRVNLNLLGLESWGRNEVQARVAKDVIKLRASSVAKILYIPYELPGEPKEWLLEVVVRLGRNFEILQVLLAVEGHIAGLDLALL
jgi:hypothetical protein